MRIQERSLLLPLGFSSLLFGAWAFGAAVPQDGQIESQHVSGPVHMLTGQGGNLGVSVGEDGVLLIDDQFARMASKIKVELDGLASDAGLDSGAPRFLINTHHHGDHTGGNVAFGAATILAHENVRARLLDPDGGQAMLPAGLPVVTYEDGLSLHFNGERLRLIHLPEGHTDGDTLVHFTGSNVVHLGDLGFNGMFPYVDFDGGGSLGGYAANVATILEQTNAETQFIPGHGPLASRADVERVSAMLKGVVRLVSAAIEDGKSAADMKSEKLLAEYDSWSWRFITSDRMIDQVLRELSGE